MQLKKKIDSIKGKTKQLIEENNIFKEKQKKEIKEKEIPLTWLISKEKQEDIKRILKEDEIKKIIELYNNKKIYEMKLEKLSIEEMKIINEVSKEVQKNNKINSVKGIKKILLNYLIEKRKSVESKQFEYLTKNIFLNCFNLGPMSILLKDHSLEEITIISPEKNIMVFEKNHGWIESNLRYTTEENIIDLINKMALNNGKRVTAKNPKINVALSDGSRMHAAIPPITKNACITIRKFKEKPFTVKELIQRKTFNIEAMALTSIAMQLDCNILIAGNTGSGKTSTLNSLFSFVPLNQRIIIVEETPEINIPHKHQIKLIVQEELNITMNELIKDSLRMRPDKIIIGEIRSKAEANSFIDTILAGQGKGSYATFHAQNGSNCIYRLTNLIKEKININAIDLIIIQKRYSEFIQKKEIEKRQVIEISEPIEKENKITLNKLFEFDYKKKQLKKINESKKILEKAIHSFGLRKNGFKKELKERIKKIKRIKTESIKEFSKEFNEI